MVSVIFPLCELKKILTAGVVQSAPPPKKRKGRPAKTPEPAIIETVATPGTTRSERSERATRRSSRFQARFIPENNSGMSDLGEFSSAPEVMGTTSSVIANDRPTTPMPSNEAIQNEAFGETESGQRSSPPPDDNDDQDLVEETLLQSQIAEEMELGSQQLTNDQQEEIVEPPSASPTFQNIKERLLSLVKDLGGAALSREEGNEMEDMFMDAKVHLYGAIKRGKELADE